MARAFRIDHRILAVNGIRIGLLICGENNILAARRSGVDWRYPEAAAPDWSGIDFLFNPLHSSMGEGGIVQARFAHITANIMNKNSYAMILTNRTIGRRGTYPSGGMAVFKNGSREYPPQRHMTVLETNETLMAYMMSITTPGGTAL